MRRGRQLPPGDARRRAAGIVGRDSGPHGRPQGFAGGGGSEEVTAAERAREEGRRAGLLEAVDFIEKRRETPSPPFQREPPAALRGRLAIALRDVRALAGPAQARLDGGEEPAAAGAQEVTARALIVLQAHLVAREKFFKEERGTYQPPTP